MFMLPQHPTFTMRESGLAMHSYALLIDRGFTGTRRSGRIALLSAIVALTLSANAQAPSTVLGDGVFVQYTSGTPPLISYGYSMFLPANSGNAYQLIGIYPAGGNSGTYSYVATGPTTGQAVQNDMTDGISFQLNLTFSSAIQGSFASSTISPAGYSQAGNFWAAIGSAPNSINGMSFRCTIVDGLYPFAGSGNFTVAFSASGNTYSTTGGPGVASSSGTFSYSIFNRSTGLLQINDSISGNSSVYLGFSTATSGAYAAKQTSTTGFQIATFALLDTTPPTVTISSPAAGQRWSNSVFTVSGTASDNAGIAAVYFQINGQGWSLATTPNNWATWSASVNLTPGTNTVQAYAVDTSANNSAVASQNVYFALLASLSVKIDGSGTLSPNYNGQMLEIGKTYSMTATAGAGFAFTNWTGTVTSTSPTLSFVMSSNLVLTANFVDVTKPTVTVASPTPGQVLNGPLVSIKGTASDNVQVAGVYFQLNTNAWKIATTANGYTNWSATLLALSGTNALKVVAVDTAGNYSVTKGVNFTASGTFTLWLSVASGGAFTSNGLDLVLKTATGVACRIDVSTNLLDWSMLTNITSSGASTPFRDPGATTTAARFYRAAVVQ
jgi:hypothetical protein